MINDFTVESPGNHFIKRLISFDMNNFEAIIEKTKMVLTTILLRIKLFLKMLSEIEKKKELLLF